MQLPTLLCLLLFVNLSTYAQENMRTAEAAERLQIGEPTEDFTATNPQGETFQLSEALKKGPVVFLFFIGGTSARSATDCLFPLP